MGSISCNGLFAGGKAATASAKMAAIGGRALDMIRKDPKAHFRTNAHTLPMAAPWEDGDVEEEEDEAEEVPF
jgi:hypothetical protein